MARPLRLEFEDAYYHLMNRALEGRRIFETDRDHEYFLSLLLDISDRWKVKIFAYCLMGNHYHLFAQTPMGNISRVMRHVDGLYAQYFNRTRKRDGPLFRGRFKAILVEAESYLLTLVRYIHLNSVKAGLADDPSSYPWSSHRLYMAPDKEILWLERETVMLNFNNAEKFDDFVCQGNDRSIEAFYKRKRYSPFMGSESFIGSMLKKLTRNPEISRLEATERGTPKLPTFPRS
ncbi:MAG: transposase [Elusimicrobiota bacterium]